ncbi:MAG TPA: DUF4340 domain-containing protein [Burkholderiales bacterium]|nr:DUF4340 domain-containing protein [Burkholderiales bacterium]
MNARSAVIFVVLLAVIGGGALFYYQQERSRRPANVGTLGQTLLKDLKAADIASIRIVEPKSTLTLQRKEQGWVIAERDGFPADLGKVRAFVLQALSLKVGQSEPIGEQDRARLNLDPSGTQVEFNGADGKGLARLIVGKKYFRGEVDSPEKAPGDGRFVMLPGDPKTVYVVSDPLRQASARSADWIERSSFKVDKVMGLEVRYPDGSRWRIERSADNAEWKLAGARPGEKLDIGRANSASYSLSLLELADVAPKETKDTGLDSPTLINATTLDGVSHSIKVGKLEGENYYVSFPSSQFIVLVPKSKLEDTLKKREALLEKKEDTKK